MNRSVMNGSVMNVVCYERSLLWTGLLWTWSVLSGRLWMVCFEWVCFGRTPSKTPWKALYTIWLATLKLKMVHCWQLSKVLWKFSVQHKRTTRCNWVLHEVQLWCISQWKQSFNRFYSKGLWWVSQMFQSCYFWKFHVHSPYDSNLFRHFRRYLSSHFLHEVKQIAKLKQSPCSCEDFFQCKSSLVATPEVLCLILWRTAEGIQKNDERVFPDSCLFVPTSEGHSVYKPETRVTHLGHTILCGH